MLGAEERRLRRIEQYAADDALMVDQEVFPSLDTRPTLPYHERY
jgi:hypothetical protein